MTTFSTQRFNPDVAKAEERLGEILTCLGKNRIPALEVGDFYEDLINEPKTQGTLAAFEEQIGIRLGLRILDQVMLEQFTKVDDMVVVENELREKIKEVNEDKLRCDSENRALKTEILSLKKSVKEAKNGSQALKNDQKTQEFELASLKSENQNLKSKLADLVKQYEQIICELRGTPLASESEPKSDQTAPKRTNSKKRKSPVPEDLSKTPVKRGKSRVLTRKLSPNEALLHSNSTQAHMDDIYFVPETLGVVESPKPPLPLPSLKVCSVPDTPEKLQTNSGLSYRFSEQTATPEKVQFHVTEIEPKVEKLPSSPVISRTLSRGGKKLRLNIREKGEGVNNPLPVPIRDRQESSKNSLKFGEDDKVRVGKVAPSVQSEIDKKSFQDLDRDFPAPKRSRKVPDISHKALVPVAPPSDTDSDFESPNLLVKRTRKREMVHPIEETEVPEFKTPKVTEKVPIQRVDSVDEIESFASPDDKPSESKKGPKKSKSVSRTNRWGMEINEITKSQKKRLDNQKQSKIDGFFKNPPLRQKSDFIRINHADTDMEKALKLSKEAEEEYPFDSENKNPKSPELVNLDNDHDKEQDVPGFAYIGEVVRSKEERQKLNGFDCRECGEYYQSKIEEGLTKDQIMKVLNKCSKHRGYFKPPLTPDKFWEADIVEGDPNSPRNKTQIGVPFRNRAKRRAEAREKRKVLKNLDNDI